MKRRIALFLAICSLLSLLTACQNAEYESPETTTEPAATQSPEEEKILRILTIGNSHSNDATRMLWEVFKHENPEQEVMLGTLYHDGCNMSQHAEFVTNNKPEYIFYTNEDGWWNEIASATVEYALKTYQWDIVVMQQMNNLAALDSYYNAEHWKTVINYIFQNQKVAPKLVFHMTWTNPSDYDMYLNDGAPLGHSAPNWRNFHEKNFPNSEGKYDQKVMYQRVIACIQKYLVNTEAFLGKNYYDYIIPSATAIQYAQDVLGRPQPEIYRDYTHMNDYGRLMVAYLWYAQIMGLSSIDAVNVNEIPQHLCNNSSQYPIMGIVDNKMKEDIVASVNWALANPFSLPQE